jgi:hypothetical protein
MCLWLRRCVGTLTLLNPLLKSGNRLQLPCQAWTGSGADGAWPCCCVTACESISRRTSVWQTVKAGSCTVTGSSWCAVTSPVTVCRYQHSSGYYWCRYCVHTIDRCTLQILCTHNRQMYITLQILCTHNRQMYIKQRPTCCDQVLKHIQKPSPLGLASNRLWTAAAAAFTAMPAAWFTVS